MSDRSSTDFSILNTARSLRRAYTLTVLFIRFSLTPTIVSAFRHNAWPMISATLSPGHFFFIEALLPESVRGNVFAAYEARGRDMSGDNEAHLVSNS